MTEQGSARLRGALVVLVFASSLASSAAAQVDYDAIRSGVAGCADLAADPTVGDLAAALCRPSDRSTLDLPISGASKLVEVRSGAYSSVQRDALLTWARGALGEAEHARLRGLLLSSEVLSATDEAARRAWLAQASDPGTDAALAAALRAQAQALVAGTFDASAPALLAARVDRNRLADLRTGLLRSPGPRNVLSSFDAGLVQSLIGFVSFGASVPSIADRDGAALITGNGAAAVGYPFFAGPDGVPSTADDLPYVEGNAAALAAGYSLAPPITGTTADRFDQVSLGLAVYSAAARRSVESAANPGTQKTVELYGVYNPSFLVRSTCTLLGGTFSAGNGSCRAAEGNDITAIARALGCETRASSRRSLGLFGIGVNADGDCIELNTASQSGSIVQYEVLGLLADPALRPAQAGLEPVDPTDLALRAAAPRGLPARPRSAEGNVAFGNLPPAWRRRVDLETGAPLSSGSAPQCRVRNNGLGMAVGPNGAHGDADDDIPTLGGCLLWSPPNAAGVQSLQSPGFVAASASANQSLFHTVCALGFDPDTGRCPLDEWNDPRSFGALTNALSGLGSGAGALVDGLDSVRTTPGDVSRRRDSEPRAARNFLFANPQSPGSADQDFGLAGELEQTALLGCGPAFASPCTTGQAQVWAASSALAASLGSVRGGGIDLLNAAASVVVQDFATVKTLQSGALVGSVERMPGELAYLPGVNFSRDGGSELRAGPGGVPIEVETGAYLALTPADAIALGSIGRASFQHGDPDKVQADGWVEPMPWAVDPDALAGFGAIVFRADPADPISGPDNVFVAGGEYCGRWMLGEETPAQTPFNQTCTLLETVSANLERALVTRSITGPDRVFDPPESLAELVAMLDGDPANDANGDPLAGPDGIFARNQRVFRSDEMDFEVVEATDSQQLGTVQIDVPADEQTAFERLMSYEPEAECGRAFCFLEVNSALTDAGDARSDFSLVLALPIGADVEPFPTKLNLARLALENPHALNRLFAGETIVANGAEVRMTLAQRRALLGAPGSATSRGVDLDGDGTTDLDRDRDGVYDGADDFTPGPVSDDEILCGSGIPGDVLQDGLQFEPWSDADAPTSSAFEDALPGGLAPRSPVFCRALNGLLALIGPSSAQSDAFLWHDGAPPEGSDTDGDRWPDIVDSCPTVANRDQADADGDGVGDACDNCVTFPNPRMSPTDYLRANPWATLTGGQRDDDHDGYGNLCDASFPPAQAPVVGEADLIAFRASMGRMRSSDACGVNHDQPCAIFDLDQVGTVTNVSDLARLRELTDRPPGPKCPTCPLECVSGPDGSCD